MNDFFLPIGEAFNLIFENFWLRNLLFCSFSISFFTVLVKCFLSICDCDGYDFFIGLRNELKYHFLFKKFLKHKLDYHEITIILEGLPNLGFCYIPPFVNVSDLLQCFAQDDLSQFSIKYDIESKKLCRSYNKFLKRYYRFILLKDGICFDDIFIPSDELFTSNNAVFLQFVLENIGIPYYLKYKFPFDFYLDIKCDLYGKKNKNN